MGKRQRAAGGGGGGGGAKLPKLEPAEAEGEEAAQAPSSEFNIKHFRKEITAKQGQTIALTQFLQVCTNPDTKHDYMLEYLTSGGNSHEILRQVTQENKKNLTLATPTFHLFHLIILKVQSSMPHLIAITEEACRYFLNTFMPTVEIMISEHSGPRHRKIIMKLLTSMITLNPDLGIEILNQAPLTPKHLQYIVEKANYKEKDNVRTAFVHFITSFFVEGHLPLMKALLEKQGLLALVIPGLIQDEGEAVMMFLNILKKNVIENINISKSLKLRTFSHQVLHNLFKMYNWKGPPEVEYQSKMEMKSTITNLISELIIILFTSHKYGLYFLDKSLGTSDAHKNQNLYKAILSLKRPWENKYQCQTILDIVDKCPDLHRALITIIEHSFEPQNSPLWENTAAFVIKMLDNMQPQEIISRIEHLNPIQITNFIRFTTLPIPLLKFLKQGVTKVDVSITTECVKVVVKMLDTLKKYLDILEMNNNDVADLIKSRLEGFIPKHLPAPDTLVLIIHHIMNAKKDIKKENSVSTQPDEAASLVVLLDLLLLYNEVHPTFLEGIEGYLDMKKILDYANTLTSEKVLLLKFKIVSLWLSLDPTAISLDKPMFSELFLIMLEAQAYEHEDKSISIELKNTLHNFLKTTSIFETGEGEIDLVLHALGNAKVEPASVFVQVMQHTLGNSEELKESIRTQSDNLGLLVEADYSRLDKLFEDLSSDNVKNIEGDILIDKKTPSPFVLGCLQLSKENKSTKESLKKFLSLYTVNLLHYYTSPNLMSAILEPYKLDAKKYVNKWLEEPTILTETLTPNDEILNKLSRFIVGEEDISLEQIFPYYEIVSEEQSEETIRGLSLKWETNVTVKSSELLVWANALIFFLLQLTMLNSLNISQLAKIAKCFDVLMAIGRKFKHVDVNRKVIHTVLTNTLTLNFFSPVEKTNKPCHKLATQFLLGVIEEYSQDVNYLQAKRQILKPYQQKNFVEVKKIFNKMSKKKTAVDDDHTIKTLEIIGMHKDETLEIVNRALDMDLSSMVTENNEPSLVIKVLGLILNKFSDNPDHVLPSEVVTNIFNLYTRILKHPQINVSLIEFEANLKDYFEKQPHHVKLISNESFKNVFSSKVVRKSTSQLAATLLEWSSKLCEVFKEEIQNPEVMTQRELALPLGNAVIQHTQFMKENKMILDSIYKEYKSSIIKVLEKPHKVGQIYMSNWKFIRKLIYECMDIDDCKKFFEKVHKFESIDTFHVNLVHATFIKFCITSNAQKKDHLINYFTMMLSLLASALKAESDYDILKDIIMNIYEVAQISKRIKSFETKEKQNFQKLTESAIWQNLCKAALKDSLKVKTSNESTESIGPKLLGLLSTLIKLFYPFNHEDIVSLFDMVTSHSEFLNVMLSHHSSDIKSRLIELLYILILRNKSVMKGQQIPVYLSAYHASRSPSDRLILTILHFYETNGQPIHEYKPYVWGDSGANYYSVRKNRTSSLWGHPTPNQIINLLEKDILEKTVRHFPVNQRLDYHYELPQIDDEDHNNLLHRMTEDGVFIPKEHKDTECEIKMYSLKMKYERALKNMKEVEYTSSSHNDDAKYLETIYDPSFILPILSQMLAAGSVVSCFKLVRMGLLSVPLMALSSHCTMMRAAGYHVLHRFCQQLETETKHRNDKLFLTDFIDTLRQSLTTAIVTAQKEKDAIKDQKNPRLPAVAAMYLARALSVATAPFDPLYKPVNNFLIAKQHIDLSVIPDFLSLFHDSDVESSDRRLWLLNVMKEGTKTMSDVNVIFKTMSLKMITDFYSTVLSDRKTKDSILSFLSVLVSVPRAAEILIEGYGIMSWLSGAFRQFKKDDKVLVSTAIQLVYNLSKSVSVNNFAKMLFDLKKTSGKDANVDINAFGELKMNKELEQQILFLLVDLLPLTINLTPYDHEMYLSTFIILSKKSLKMMSRKQMLFLIRNGTEGFEKSRSVQILLRAVATNDSDILRVKNISLDIDDAEDYNVKVSLVQHLRTLVQRFI